MSEEPEGSRPNLLRRAVAGAWHVPAGFAFLVRNPRLWPLAALPSLAAVGGLFLGVLGAFYTLPGVEGVLAPSPGRVGEWVSVLVTFVLDVGVLGAGALVGLGVALLLTAPILERLSQRVEERVRGTAPGQGNGLRWEIAQSLRGGLYFLAATPVVFVLSLVPLLGTALAALWGAYALAFQQTDAPLARRGLDFTGRRRWHGRWRAESVGFGLAGLVFLVVPCAGLMVAPALTVGATLMVLELEEGL